jgi:uncharacterized membrane protein YfcA
VPLLVLIGLPGGVANGTNRIGVLIQYGVAAWRFRRAGIWDAGSAGVELAAVAAGALAGALLVVQLSDRAFERAFAFAMLALLVPTLRRPPAGDGPPRPRPPAWLRAPIFFAIGLYGGALQAGVGVLLVFALSYSGYDLVRANSLKAFINFFFCLFAVPVFIAEGKVSWLPALVLAAGFAAGGELGARLAVRGGERLIRPVLVLAVVALAGRMLGLY